jgi:ribosomal protein L11 methyltransferase
MVQLEDRTLLLDLEVAAAMLAQIPNLEEEQQVVREEGLGPAPTPGQLARLVSLLSRVAPPAFASTPLCYDFTYSRPLRIGRIVLTSGNDPAPPEDGGIVIRLELGLAYGSGLGANTRLSLQTLQELPLSGLRIADATTGAGTLAIAAAKLGAAVVHAVDVLPAAVEIARRNVARNDCAHLVEVRHGSVEELEDGYDLILANPWTVDMAWAMLSGLASRVRAGGRLITRAGGSAGPFRPGSPEFTRALRRLGLTVEKVDQDRNWLQFVAIRES